LSEENADIPFAERQQWSRYWLVDPLDGTKEFIAGRDEYTVNIALIENGCPILGVVAVPPTGVTYWAARGAGAWRRASESDEARRLRVADSDPETLRVAVSRSHADAATARFLAALPEAVALPLGSSIKLCAVAEGSAHLYPRFGPTSIWDIAAAHCVVTEAGGRVSPMGDLAALCTYFPRQVLNPPFIAYGGNPQYWREALRA
jgi:3'(2'), 5'-bisphosphate nucleotidase